MSGNWSIVGYPSDPIPDDPAVVAAHVDHIKAVAADLAAQIAALPTDGAIDAVPWRSDNGAPERFKEVVKKLPADLGKLRVRYEKVGAAMAGFQATLASAKAQAQANLAKAETAQNDIAAAQAGVAQMNDFAAQAQHQASTQNASAPPGTPPAQPHPWTGPDYHAQLAAARAAFNAAKSAIDQAVNQFHDASRTAAAAVGAASQDALKNDSGFMNSIGRAFESFGHWVAQRVPLHAIAGILNKIAAVAAILSFIPVLGAIPGIVGMVAVGLALACDILIALDDAYQGKLGWHNAIAIGIDLASLAAGGYALRAVRVEAAAAATAKSSTAFADQAVATAKIASAGEKGAVATETAARAKVVSWTDCNPVKAWAGRIFGVTSRAQSALGTAAHAVAAIKEAQAAAEAAKVTAAVDAATANAVHTDLVWANTGNAVIGGVGVVNTVAHEPVGGSNPAVALARSTTMEISGIVNWNDDPTGTAAQSLGSQIPAQPIPVLSGG